MKALIIENHSATKLAIASELRRLGYEVEFEDRLPLKKGELAPYEVAVVGFVTSAIVSACARAGVKLICAVSYQSLQEREAMSLDRLAGSLNFIQLAGTMPSELSRAAAMEVSFHRPEIQLSGTETPVPANEEGVASDAPTPQEALASQGMDDDIPF